MSDKRKSKKANQEDKKMKKFYKAHFRDVEHGDFYVICYGWNKSEEEFGTVYPSVESAINMYCDNCMFIGLA